MAGIDHTIITYKNGKLMKDTVKFTDDDQCVSLLPFSYNRTAPFSVTTLEEAFPSGGTRSR